MSLRTFCLVDVDGSDIQVWSSFPGQTGYHDGLCDVVDTCEALSKADAKEIFRNRAADPDRGYARAGIVVTFGLLLCLCVTGCQPTSTAQAVVARGELDFNECVSLVEQKFGRKFDVQPTMSLTSIEQSGLSASLQGLMFVGQALGTVHENQIYLFTDYADKVENYDVFNTAVHELTHLMAYQMGVPRKYDGLRPDWPEDLRTATEEFALHVNEMLAYRTADQLTWEKYGKVCDTNMSNSAYIGNDKPFAATVKMLLGDMPVREGYEQILTPVRALGFYMIATDQGN